MGGERADEPSAPVARSFEANAAKAALEEADVRAAKALIADVTQWMNDNFQAAIPVLARVFAALNPIIGATPSKPVAEVGEEAKHSRSL